MITPARPQPGSPKHGDARPPIAATVTYSCPWCPVHVDDDAPHVSFAMRHFERHLDTHFAYTVREAA